MKPVLDYLIIQYKVDEPKIKHYLKGFKIIHNNKHRIDEVELEWTKNIYEGRLMSETLADETYYKLRYYINGYPFISYIETLTEEVKQYGKSRKKSAI